MTNTKTINWTTAGGKKITAVLTYQSTYHAAEEIDGGFGGTKSAYVYKNKHVELFFDGKSLGTSNGFSALYPNSSKQDKQAVEAGATIRFSGNKGSYTLNGITIDEIDAVWAELEATTDDDNVKTMNATEETKKQTAIENEKKVKALLDNRSKNGICPICGGYCYGDCKNK